MTFGKANKIFSIGGRVAIVTGANSGLGFETTKGLAARGIHVVMACRNVEKGMLAKEQIEQEISYADLSVIEIDTSSLESVCSFATQFIERSNRLDILVNNAGVMLAPYSETEEGFERHFATNYLGHFLLTDLLLPTLERTPNSRIVSVSSIAHNHAAINFDDLQFKKNYSPWKAYAQSKLACLMFAYELNKRLRKTKSTTISVATHPGVSFTQLSQYLPKWILLLSPLLRLFIGHKPSRAAQPILVAAIAPDVEGGDYYGPDGRGEWSGDPVKTDSSLNSKDPELTQKLWDVSEKLIGLKYKTSKETKNHESFMVIA